MNGLEQETLLLLVLVVGLVALCVCAPLAVIIVRQNRLLRTYRGLLNGPTGRDLETMLLLHDDAVRRGEAQLAALGHRVERIEVQARTHLQRVGTVRFSAFPDIGSDLSFAIALLDGGNNGIVLSSLYGRSESRVYAKPVREGVSTYPLSGEEKDAIVAATRTSP